MNIFKNLFEGFIQEDNGFMSYKYSIGIYAPDDNIESILFGRKGYYD